MVSGPVVVKVLTPLYDRLQRSLDQGDLISGALYGLEVEGVKIIVAAAGKDASEQGDNNKKVELELLNEMIPCGVEPVGVFGVGLTCDQLTGVCAQLPPLTQPSDTPVILSVNSDVQAR